MQYRGTNTAYPEVRSAALRLTPPQPPHECEPGGSNSYRSRSPQPGTWRADTDDRLSNASGFHPLRFPVATSGRSPANEAKRIILSRGQAHRTSESYIPAELFLADGGLSSRETTVVRFAGSRSRKRSLSGLSGSSRAETPIASTNWRNCEQGSATRGPRRRPRVAKESGPSESEFDVSSKERPTKSSGLTNGYSS